MGMHTISSVNLVFCLHLVLHLIVSQKKLVMLLHCQAMFCNAAQARLSRAKSADAGQNSGCIYYMHAYVFVNTPDAKQPCVCLSRHYGMVASQH